ncbi:DNA-binding protein [Frigoribacterium faeni]|uniref:DNA-binding protein n=2 Tax=Frigoribacterium faeni TaxID=145483 RepID=A0ABQ0UTB3_9MICO|nr:DNA-binding protein [Frigoribacterium faeni]
MLRPGADPGARACDTAVSRAWHSGRMPTSDEDLDRFCRDLPSAEVTHPFGPETSVYKVRGRMFAMFPTGMTAVDPGPLGVGRLWVNLKAVPEHAAALVAQHPEVSPGWHMNKRHWITLDLAGDLPDRTVEDLVGNSYDCVIAAMPATRRPLA